jgi:hypothetical protein
MTAASRSAYQEGDDSRKTKAQVLLDIIRVQSVADVAEQFRGATLDELCVSTQWPTNVVSARLSELADLGMIRETGMRGTHTIWVVSEPWEVAQLQKKRKEEKPYVAEVQQAIPLSAEDKIVVTINVPGNIWRNSRKRVLVS